MPKRCRVGNLLQLQGTINQQLEGRCQSIGLQIFLAMTSPVLSPSIIYNNLIALFMYLPHRYAYLTTKQNEKEEKSAIYPFHVDYSSLRQKKQQVKLPQIEVESTQPIGSESAASEQGQSQEYSDSFESYYDSFREESISEESDSLE